MTISAAALANLPNASSQKPPDGYYRLIPGIHRKAGDLFWTTSGWVVSHITDGAIPDNGALYCRKAILANQPRAENPPKPVKGETQVFHLRDTTPLFYLISDPFNEREQLLVYQIDEIQSALGYVQDSQIDWCMLFVVFRDENTKEYDRHALLWRQDGKIQDPTGLIASTKSTTLLHGGL